MISFSILSIFPAVSALEKPSKKQIDVLRSARDIKIVLHQSQDMGINIEFSPEEEENTKAMLSAFLKYAKLQIKQEDVKNYDAILEIKMRWASRDRQIFISGDILFKGPDMPAYRSFYEGNFYPGWLVNLLYRLGEMTKQVYDFDEVDFLIIELKNKNKGIRSQAAELLYYKTYNRIDPRTVEPLIASLSDEYEYVRKYAVMAMGEIKDTRAVERLITVFKDKDLDVRYAATQALKKIGDAAVKPLIACLKDKDPYVREVAIAILRDMKEPKAIEPLITALKDEDWNVRNTTAKALKNITGQDFGKDQAKWQEWWEQNKIKFGECKEKDLIRSVSEKYLGKIDFSSLPEGIIEYLFTISPNKEHFAFVVKRDNGMCVIVDGKEQKKYDSIWGAGADRKGTFGDRTVIYGYDRKPIFSPDSNKIAYVAQEGTKKFVVVNAIEGKRYDEVCSYKFSPDSQRFGYLAKEAGKIFAIVDAIEGKRYDDVSWFNFSPDSKRFAYIAWVGEREFIVVDGHEKKEYPDIYNIMDYTFSPDGRKLSYIAEGKGAKDFVVINDVKGKLYNRIGEFLFSSDSKRFAYEAGKDGKSFVVIDGVEFTKYSKPSYDKYHVTFSPNSKRVAFIAREGNKEFVVVDGGEGKRYEYNSIGEIHFSPDSKRVAFSVNEGNKSFLVIDGAEETKYENCYIFDVVFSPDSNKVAYLVGCGNKYFGVMDKIEGKKYDKVRSIDFTPDSKRITYIAKEGKKSFVVIDHKEGAKYEYLDQKEVCTGKIIFDSPNKLLYNAMKGDEIYLICEKIQED
jgi:WD40 repeat protein